MMLHRDILGLCVPPTRLALRQPRISLNRLVTGVYGLSGAVLLQMHAQCTSPLGETPAGTLVGWRQAIV